MALDDFDRPLNKRGKLNAPLMGAVLKKQNVKPDVILSSPALRAKTTAEIVAKELDYSKEVLCLQDIYEASANELDKLLKTLETKHETVFIFGHNPGFNDLAYKYVGFDDNVPTCGVLEIAFECKKWSDISASNATLISFDYPKKHR